MIQPHRRQQRRFHNSHRAAQSKCAPESLAKACLAVPYPTSSLLAVISGLKIDDRFPTPIPVPLSALVLVAPRLPSVPVSPRDGAEGRVAQMLAP